MSSDLRLILPFEISNSNYNGREYFASGGTTSHEKNVFGSFDDRDMMTRSKRLAFKPCHKKSSNLEFHSQMHKVHILLNHDSKSPRKRKLHQYINNDKFATTFDLTGKEKYDKVRRRIHTSSLSCSPLFEEKEIILQVPEEHVAFPAPNDKVEYCTFCTQDYSHLSDSNDYIKEPSATKQKRMKSQPKDLTASSSYTFSIEKPIREKPNMEFAKSLKLFNKDFVYSKTIPSLSSKEEEVELIHPHKNFLPSRGIHLPRPIIPIGPRFQAEVPKWEDTTNMKHHNSYDNLKWLGTQIWPMPIFSKMNSKGIGKGRRDSCLCDFPGSVDCVKKHISEARKLLKLEIGTAFLCWKFDDMGEEVSKSWTSKEQKKFELLVKFNPLSNDTNFWELAMEYFPSKSMKCLVNYYYNIYIPRRMSLETRSSISAVDREPK